MGLHIVRTLYFQLLRRRNHLVGNLTCINRLPNEIEMRISSIDISIDFLFKMMTQIDSYVTNREHVVIVYHVSKCESSFRRIWHRPSV